MKIFTGTVLTVGMQNTVVVRVERKIAHPLYQKLLRRSKKYKVDTAGKAINIGDMVKIGETKPMSKDKYFKIVEVVKEKKKWFNTELF